MEKENRSPRRIVQSAVDIKSWIARPPSVDEVRPTSCPCCGTAGRPLGCGLMIWGHGVRERQLRGPLEPDGAPGIVTVTARRYLCKRCGAALLVVPRGVLPRRYYPASAIALALTLFGVARLPAAAVRRRISPSALIGATATTHWITLRRWIVAIRRGELFRDIRGIPASWSARQASERAATTLASLGPPTLRGPPLTERAFAGAAHAT